MIPFPTPLKIPGLAAQTRNEEFPAAESSRFPASNRCDKRVLCMPSVLPTLQSRAKAVVARNGGPRGSSSGHRLLDRDRPQEEAGTIQATGTDCVCQVPENYDRLSGL